MTDEFTPAILPQRTAPTMGKNPAAWEEAGGPAATIQQPSTPTRSGRRLLTKTEQDLARKAAQAQLAEQRKAALLEAMKQEGYQSPVAGQPLDRTPRELPPEVMARFAAADAPQQQQRPGFADRLVGMIPQGMINTVNEMRTGVKPDRDGNIRLRDGSVMSASHVRSIKNPTGIPLDQVDPSFLDLPQ